MSQPAHPYVMYSATGWLLTLGAAIVACMTGGRLEASALRRTAIVRAVELARPSVVNIHGHKTIRGDGDAYGAPNEMRRVNGMGTGVVIDPRGYVLTNFHVVDGVRRIQVTTAEGRPYVARLVAHDPVTDLAVIKIPVTGTIPVIHLGTSRDLMNGEPVVAVGNAYGYEHTVTRGIISALHRNVQVNDTQEYHDLIQTDASINPGNSGGPLLNIDGEMIGVNVAVRVGAQGIGFAIPVDKAMTVAARLLSAERVAGIVHGLETEDDFRDEQPIVVVRNIKSGSPAVEAGIHPGDVIRRVNGQKVERSLDLERALLELPAGEKVAVNMERASQPLDVDLSLRSSTAEPTSPISEQAWQVLGARFSVASPDFVHRSSPRFRGGLIVQEVRLDSPAARQGIRKGDILVGMHTWETISFENLSYVMDHAEFDADTISLYLLRGDKTLAGRMPVAWLR